MVKNFNEWWKNNLTTFCVKTYSFWERMGIHVVPNDFYQPIPDLRNLTDDLWTREYDMTGIDVRERQQLELLSGFVSSFRTEYDALPRRRTGSPHEYFVFNGTFETVDGEMLYCMVRHFKPSRMVEVGSGNSTFLSAKALMQNKREREDQSCQFVAIEPFPSPALRGGLPGLTRLIPTRLQDVDISEFVDLGKNDILFIDSSHISMIGSDVNHIFQRVLPILRKGVVVHFHDIFLPREYRRNWVLGSKLFFNEQYLLHAFMSFNDSFEVLWAGSYMHLRHPTELEKAFSSYDSSQHWPGSFWIRKTK